MNDKTEAALPAGPYLSLVTFRRDGTEVATPLWFVELEGVLHAYTKAESPKVRRLRNNPAARIAPCTASGKPTGPWQEATAREIADPHRIAQVYRAMARKYPFGYRLLTFIAWLGRNHKDRAVLEIVAAPAA